VTTDSTAKPIDSTLANAYTLAIAVTHIQMEAAKLQAALDEELESKDSDQDGATA